MSNRIKIKKHKSKDKHSEKNTDIQNPKYGAKFQNEKREKGTTSSKFSGKSSKEFSRKKT